MARRTPKALVESELLRWARRTSGLGVEDVAKKVQVTPDKIAGWEAGADRPTVAQLRKLAHAYRRPLAVFFRSEPPKEEPEPQDFRSGRSAPMSPALRVEIRKARRRRSVSLEFGSARPVGLPECSTKEDPEEVALRLRAWLSVDLRDQVEWKDANRALNEWVRAVEDRGILVFHASGIDPGEMRGLSLSHDRLPLILLNGADVAVGRSFTLMHELAHLMLRNAGVCGDLTADSDNDVEVFCNAVAGATLVPSEELLLHPIVRRTTTGWSSRAIGEVAAHFSVSEEVVARRLLTLEQITERFYSHLRRLYLRRVAAMKEAEKRRTGGPKYYTLACRNLGNLYRRIVLVALQSGEATLMQAVDFLGVKAEHVEAMAADLGYQID